MKTDIFKAIQKALEGSEVRHTDLNKGQLDHAKQSFPFPNPAVLVSFPDGDAEHIVDNGIEEDTIIDVLLILDEITESFSGAKTQAKNLDRYALTMDVINRLAFIEGDCFSELHYMGQGEEFSPAQTRITLKFSTKYTFKLNPYVSRI